METIMKIDYENGFYLCPISLKGKYPSVNSAMDEQKYYLYL